MKMRTRPTYTISKPNIMKLSPLTEKDGDLLDCIAPAGPAERPPWWLWGHAFEVDTGELSTLAVWFLWTASEIALALGVITDDDEDIDSPRDSARSIVLISVCEAAKHATRLDIEGNNSSFESSSHNQTQTKKPAKPANYRSKG